MFRPVASPPSATSLTVSDLHCRFRHWRRPSFAALPAAASQVEPEMGMYADIVYSADGSKVERLVPRKVAAFNDCSIRKLDGAGPQ